MASSTHDLIALGRRARRGRRRRICPVASRAGRTDRRRRAHDRDPRRARGRRPARGHQGAEGRPRPRRRRRRRAVRARADRVGGAGARSACRRDGRPRPRLCRRARRGDRLAGGRDRQGEIAAGLCGSAARPRATLARSDVASQQALDQAENDVATARADVAEAEANHAAAVPGRPESSAPSPTRRSRRRRPRSRCSSGGWKRPILRAPADGVVSVIVAEVGENIRAGQPVLAIEETGKQWLSFNAREDLLHGLAVGSDSRRRAAGRARNDAGARHRAPAARVVRDLAGRARGRRPRSQYAAPAA